MKIDKELLEATKNMFENRKIPEHLVSLFFKNMKEFEDQFQTLNEGDIHYLFFVYVMGAAAGIDISNELEFQAHYKKVAGKMQ